MPDNGESQAFAQDDARWSALMESAQAGHEENYRQLLVEVSIVLRQYLLQRLGGGSYVDDCVQEVLLAVHQARHTYDPARKFRPWLFAIARYKAIDCMRRLKYSQQQELLHDDLAGVRGNAEDIEGAIVSGELINALAEPFREAITLTKLHGLSVREAAAHLSISESAVKVRVHRGIHRLRKLLEAEPI